MNLKLFAFGIALSVAGCGSSSSSGGGSCSGISATDPVFTTVTKAAGSDAACPDITPALLNSGGGAGDSGSSSCLTVADEHACTLSLECNDADTKTTGSFAVTGKSFSGDLTVTVTASSLTCKYTLSGTI